MPYILNIDTTVTTASVCLAKDDEPLAFRLNPTRNDHAAWLHPAILEVMQEANLQLIQLDAIAISAGPGSYTGLRVGMSAAKGLCYALQKPLILVSTLQMMAAAALPVAEGLLCPMIDARRMEIFTAIYDQQLNEVMSPSNLIVESNPFLEELSHKIVTFFGNGCGKLVPVLEHSNARFADVEATAQVMTGLSFNKFREAQFADLAYTEPFYGKEFYTPAAKNRTKNQ